MKYDPNLSQRKDILDKEKEIRKWIRQKQSKAFICRQLNCKPETLERYLSLMGIDYSGNQGLKGIKQSKRRKTALEYINSGSEIQTNKLKKKLIEDKLKEYKCENCGRTTWKGEPIPLELHHIDGDRFNNQLDNLKILCPNCHDLVEDKNSFGTKRSHKGYCKDCGIKISSRGEHCKSCAARASATYKTDWPSTPKLIKIIKETSYTEVGRRLEVSDNAVRKRIKTRTNIDPKQLV